MQRPGKTICILEQNQGYCSLISLVEGRRSLHPSDEDLSPGTPGCWSRRLECVVFGIRHLWFCYKRQPSANRAVLQYICPYRFCRRWLFLEEKATLRHHSCVQQLENRYSRPIRHSPVGRWAWRS